MRNEGKTLGEIGIFWGISRERVRQIIGNTGREFRREWTKSIAEGKISFMKHRDQLSGVVGVKKVWKEMWGNFRHSAIGGAVKSGQEFEERAYGILLANGVENSLMPNSFPFDIKTSSGLRIDVKVTNNDVSRHASQNYLGPVYHTGRTKSGKDCDFLFVFVPDENEKTGYTYFVIPGFELHHLRGDAHIRIPWPAKTNRVSKWHKYHKRLDLLKD